MKKHQLLSLRAHYALLIFFFLTLVGAGQALSQSATPSWIWEGGSKEPNAAGHYGTLHKAADTNVPGARSSSVTWTDGSGAVWLFGGSTHTDGGETYFNDLWKYDGTNWSWESGSDEANQPGVYGPRTGTTGTPGARKNAVGWSDGTVLWLFGGNGYDGQMPAATGQLDDLWKYDITNKEWTWVSGSKTVNAPGTYGPQGTAVSTNVPGAREDAVTWREASGVLWLFGGYGYGETSSLSYLNDLWKYDTSSNQWTWVSGEKASDALGNYGTQGTAASTNMPGARRGAVSWMDTHSGTLWLFGGSGYDETTSASQLNDLWKYDTSSDAWTWVSGGNVVNQPGVYGTETGTMGTPGARENAVGWSDGIALWLFGGHGYDGQMPAATGQMNDLWRYDINSEEWTWVSGSSVVSQAGEYGAEAGTPGAGTPGARENAVGWKDAAGNMWLFGGHGGSLRVKGITTCGGSNFPSSLLPGRRITSAFPVTIRSPFLPVRALATTTP